MQDNTIHIAFNIDRRYVAQCTVTMVSVMENNRNARPLWFHIVEETLSDDQRSLIRGFAERYGHRVSFYRPDADALKGFAIKRFSHRITMATYYRCLLSDLLPESLSRVLYLDCDILVLEPLDDFFDTPLDNAPVAAVADMACNDRQRYTTLCYPADDSYFNAGVLLVNLDYWREHNVPKACADYYNAHPERILFNDQDLLNSLFHANKKFVSIKWNMQDAFYRTRQQFDPVLHQHTPSDLLHPCILHFTNRKPWEWDNQHPLRHLYAQYEEKAVSVCPSSPLASLWHAAARALKLLPYRLRLRKPKYITLK